MPMLAVQTAPEETSDCVSIPPEVAEYRRSLQVAALLFMRMPQSEATAKVLSFLRPLTTLFQTAEKTEMPGLFLTQGQLDRIESTLSSHNFHVTGFKRAKSFISKIQRGAPDIEAELQQTLIRLASKIIRNGVIFRVLENIIAAAHDREALEDIYATTIASLSSRLEAKGKFHNEVQWIVDSVKTRALQITLPRPSRSNDASASYRLHRRLSTSLTRPKGATFRNSETQKLSADKVIDMILEEVIQHGTFRNTPDFNAHIGWSRTRTFLNILDPFVRRRILRCYGRGSGAFYVAAENFPHKKVKIRVPLHKLPMEILALVERDGTFSVSAEIVDLLGWHRNTILEAVRALKDAGQLVQEGTHRWTIYKNGEGSIDIQDGVTPVSKRVREGIVQALQDGNGVFRTSQEFLGDVRADRGTVSRVIADLINQGVLERRGGKRGPTVHYVQFGKSATRKGSPQEAIL